MVVVGFQVNGSIERKWLKYLAGFIAGSMGTVSLTLIVGLSVGYSENSGIGKSYVLYGYQNFLGFGLLSMCSVLVFQLIDRKG